MQDPTTASSTQSKGWLKYIIIGLVSFFLLICLFVGGILFFVFSQLKDSEAAKMAVAILHASPAAKENVGEIQDTGWPIGNFSVDGGGTGKASFSMSVKGSKAKAKYFASLYRQHGIWHYQSGRLQMPDGRSVDIVASGGSPGAPPAPALPAVPAPSAPGGSGGRQLGKTEDIAGWVAVSWPEQPVTFKVPAEWKQDALARREVEYRPEDRSAYFIANATFFDQKIPYDNIFPSLLQKSANQLERGEILGYAMKNLGRAQGLFELQKRGDGQTTAVWTGYFDDEKYGTVSLTVLLGAPTPEQFDRAEPVLGAILESIQVK
jgi:hypothetical protein